MTRILNVDCDEKVRVPRGAMGYGALHGPDNDLARYATTSSDRMVQDGFEYIKQHTIRSIASFVAHDNVVAGRCPDNHRCFKVDILEK